MSSKQERDPRPPGLTVLAVFNFFNFAASCVYLIVLYSGGFTEQPSAVITFLAAVSGLLAAISAIGFLRRHYLMGFGVGNAFGVFLLVYSVGFLASKQSANPMEYFAWLSYPVILLVLLNLFYRKEFEGNRKEL